MSRLIIGLAGFRRTGKSTIAKHLIKNEGFRSVHPFEIWKIGIAAMYEAIGIPHDEAIAMVDGHLKDTPHPELPDGADSRYLMEKTGKFAGTVLGPQWTIGLALQRLEKTHPNDNLVIESVVYEVDVIRKFGGHITKIERDGTEGTGLETDEFTRRIVPDSSFYNDEFDEAGLGPKFMRHLQAQGLWKVPARQIEEPDESSMSPM